MDKKLNKNYIYNLVYQILSLLIPVITLPYISRIFSANDIGAISYTSSIVTYFLLIADLGTSLYGQCNIAYNQNNKEKRSAIFCKVFFLRLFLSLTCLAAYLGYVFLFVKSYKLLSLVQSIILLCNMFDISWFLLGMEKLKEIVLCNLIGRVFYVGILFLTIKSSKDLILYAIFVSVSTLISFLLEWIYCLRNVCAINFRHFDFHINFKEILSLFLPTLAIQVYTVADKTMLGIFTIDKIENGYYEQTEKIVRMILLIVSSLSTVVAPRVAKLFSENKYNEISICIENSFHIVWLFSIPIMFGLIGISDFFVPVFFGAGYEKIQLLLPIYSLILIPVSVSSVLALQYLIPVKKQKIYTFAVSASAFFNIFANLFFIPRFLSVGASITTVVAEYIGAVIMLIYINSKRLLPIKKYLLHDSYKNWIAGVVMFCVIILIKRELCISIISMLIIIVLAVLVYFVILLLLHDNYLSKVLKNHSLFV